MADDPRYHPELRRRLSPAEEARLRRHGERDDVAQLKELLRVAIDALQERAKGDDTSRFSVPPADVIESEPDTQRTVQTWVPAWHRLVAVAVVVAAIAGGAFAVVQSVVAAQSWVARAITIEVAPVKEDVSAIQRDVAELLRRSR